MTKSTRFVSEEPFGPENGWGFIRFASTAVQGLAERVFFAEDFSRAKAQSAAAFSEVFFASLRLCARNILATDAP